MAHDQGEECTPLASEINAEQDAPATVDSKGPGAEACLIERARTDRLAFGALYEAYYSQILNYIYRCTLNRSLAEELTSNTFFKALRSFGTYVPRTPFRCWLYRIATNEVRMHWRKEKIRRLYGLETRSEPLEESADFAQPEVEVREEQRAQLRKFMRLHDLLSELPGRYQAPLRLRFIEQLSLGEIAHVLGKRLGTVKSLIHRGLARLRRQLEQDATFQEDANYRPVEMERSL
jgi:RNA polymerase sigma-70 factor (ECF subfamily)